MLTIKAEKREGKNTNVELRKQGIIPAVFYGPKESNTPIKINESDFMKIYENAGESTVINLNDGSTDHEALIHDVQFDAVTGRPIHADFYIIEKGKKVEVSVPLSFIGEAPAEEQLGGVLVKVMHELDIEAMPKDLPHEIEVDISSLVNFETQILVKDLKIPAGVEVKAEPDEVVALVQEHKEEVIEETTPDLDSIEVEQKGKGEEGGGEGEEKKKED